MARKFDELRAKMTPERRAAIDAEVDRLDAELHLGELRKARELTQEQLATELGVAQSEVSRIERRADVYVSTLRRFVQAMGGELDIVVRFPEGDDVRLTQFSG